MNDRWSWGGVRVSPSVVTWAPALAALIYTALTMRQGIPVLRHDWALPVGRSGFLNLLISSFSGWLPYGIGVPHPYPTLYLVGPLLAVIGLGIGSVPFAWIYVYAVGAAMAYAGRAIALAFGAPPLAAAAASYLAIFNMWTYTETVAGHCMMIAALAGCAFLIAELLRDAPRRRVTAAAVVLLSVQLQFFVLCTIGLAAAAALRRKGASQALLVSAVLAFPLFPGIALNLGPLLDTPQSTSWWSAQGVPLLLGYVGNGYFARYTARLPQTAVVAANLTAIMALVSVVIKPRRRIVLTAAAVAALLLVTDLPDSPQGEAVLGAVRRAPELGLFRELYDLIGFVVIGLIALASAATARARLVGTTALAVAAMCGTAAWFPTPPSWYFVGASHITPLEYPARDSRVALYPPFQPLSLRTRGGSGLDYDAVNIDLSRTVVNEYFPSYPVASALGAYALEHDSRPLQALGVGEILGRGNLVIDSGAIRGQSAFSVDARRYDIGNARVELHAEPVLALGPVPAMGAMPQTGGAAQVFFGDAAAAADADIRLPKSWRAAPTVRPVSAGVSGIDPGRDWIDARLGLTVLPQTGTALGGVLTTSRTPFDLSEQQGGLVLAYVDGTLEVDGHNARRDRGGYAWIPLPRHASTLRCNGTCVLGAFAPRVASQPRPIGSFVPLDVRYPLPWIWVSTVPPSGTGAIRMAVRYASDWHAFSGGTDLPHFRYDASFNGWMLNGSARQRTIVIVHLTSIFQTVAELASIVVLGMLLLRKPEPVKPVSTRARDDLFRAALSRAEPRTSSRDDLGLGWLP